MASSKTRVKVFSLTKYVEAALRLAEYRRDEKGFIIARVPRASGFFSQGKTYEEARANLQDAIEGNVVMALQLGWDVPPLPGIEIEERDVKNHPAKA